MNSHPTFKRLPYYDDRADWSLIPQHMHQGVHDYVMHGAGPGDFLTKLLSNDFFGAVGRADDENQRHLVGWATFIYNYTPAACHGSRNKVAAWVVKGGIDGQG